MGNSLVKRDVQGEIKARIARVLRRDVDVVSLSRHAFKDDGELDALKLSARDRRVVRSWEEPKRTVPFALEAASRRVEAMLKAQQEKAKTTVNVQNMTIQLPEKRADAIEAVVIEVESK